MKKYTEQFSKFSMLKENQEFYRVMSLQMKGVLMEWGSDNIKNFENLLKCFFLNIQDVVSPDTDVRLWTVHS